VNWTIKALSPAHDRSAFSCGHAGLDTHLRRFAGQHARKGFGRTFVATRPRETRVFAYYTLSSSSVAFADAPSDLARKLPQYPIPVALLGKLAVDQSARGERLGEHILMDALHRVLAVATEMAIYAVEVHAIDDNARRFYERYGFTPFEDHPHHLFLPLATIEKLWRSAGAIFMI